MLKKIIDRLGKAGLTGWQVRHSKKKSFQSFLAKDEKECDRFTDTESCLVSIYQKRDVPVFFDTSHGNGHGEEKPSPDSKPVLGLSNFKVTPQNVGDLDSFLEEAVFSAQLVNNQPFELPSQPKNMIDVEIADATMSERSLEECEGRLLKALSKEKNISLAGAEFFIDRIHTRLLNHNGLDVEQDETQIQTEFILLAKKGKKENEFINRTTRRLMRDFNLEHEVRQSARYALEATTATLPKTGTFPVLLSEEPLDQLFNPVLARASARLKYNKMMNTPLGRSVLADGEVKGDKITLWSNGLLKGGLASSKFDSYGTPSRRVNLIENNLLKQYLADKRYADYLNLPVTGEMGNLEIAPGSKTFSEFLEPEGWGVDVIYHLQAFSAFEPNPITGAFSAEIRAGYEISSKGVRPIKGGSVSGVLQRDLLNCFLSKETQQREHALVPKGVFFRQLTIAGA